MKVMKNGLHNKWKIAKITTLHKKAARWRSLTTDPCPKYAL